VGMFSRESRVVAISTRGNGGVLISLYSYYKPKFLAKLLQRSTKAEITYWGSRPGMPGFRDQEGRFPDSVALADYLEMVRIMYEAHNGVPHTGLWYTSIPGPLVEA